MPIGIFQRTRALNDPRTVALLAHLETRLDEGDRTILKELSVKNEVTLDHVCSLLGVSKATACTRLRKLRTLGLVKEVRVKGGRGRPRSAYILTDLGRAMAGYMEGRSEAVESLVKALASGGYEVVAKGYLRRLMATSAASLAVLALLLFSVGGKYLFLSATLALNPWACAASLESMNIEGIAPGYWFRGFVGTKE